MSEPQSEASVGLLPSNEVFGVCLSLSMSRIGQNLGRHQQYCILHSTDETSRTSYNFQSMHQNIFLICNLVTEKEKL